MNRCLLVSCKSLVLVTALVHSGTDETIAADMQQQLGGILLLQYGQAGEVGRDQMAYHMAMMGCKGDAAIRQSIMDLLNGITAYTRQIGNAHDVALARDLSGRLNVHVHRIKWQQPITPPSVAVVRPVVTQPGVVPPPVVDQRTAPSYCGVCNGIGSRTCGTCRGTGIEDYTAFGGLGNDNRWTCRSCNGAGRIPCIGCR